MKIINSSACDFKFLFIHGLAFSGTSVVTLKIAEMFNGSVIGGGKHNYEGNIYSKAVGF